MKNLISTLTIFFLLFSNSFSQGWTIYNSDGIGKCQGLKFSIKYPGDWTIKDGAGQHIVKKFVHEENRGAVQMLVYINKMDHSLTQSEINNTLNKNYLLSTFKVRKIMEFNDQAKIDGERYAYASIQNEEEMNNQTFRSIIKTNAILWKDYLVQINFFIYSNDQSFETMTKMYNEYNSVLQEIMGSFFLTSKRKQ
jgi:hypothetical protein